MGTRLTPPPPAKAPVPCTVCGQRFHDGALLEWQMCSSVCADVDRTTRFQRRTTDPEEDRQAAREERLQLALEARWRASHAGMPIGNDAWLQLAEADLGNYKGAEIAQRIDELVQLYGVARFRTLTSEDVRARLWAMVP